MRQLLYIHIVKAQPTEPLLKKGSVDKASLQPVDQIDIKTINF